MIGPYLLRQSGLGQFEQLLEPIKAQIQAQVGEFLQAKAFLLDARARARTPEDLLRADELLGRQAGLEAELGVVLPPIQAGTLSPATLASATAFAVRLTSHMGDVRRFQRHMSAVPPAPGLPWGQVALWGGGALVVLVVLSQMGRR